MKSIAMRTVLLFVLLFSLNVAFGYNQGDILFQESKSSQSKYIKAATGSRYTHCGIIYKKNGKDYVLEASNKVKLTPVKEWINRGVGKHVKVKKCPVKGFSINLKKYLGKAYDTSFSWTDNKMYCSELVYKIYQDNGIKLCALRKVKDYNIKPYRNYLKKRGISLDERVVAPSDLLK